MVHDPGARGRRDAGFTLLEALVAFVIAAAALGALTQGAAGGLQAVRLSSHYQEALSRARSRLATVGDTPAPGEQRGDDGGGYSWQVTVSPVATAARPPPGDAPAGDARPGRAVLLAVTVRVAWSLDGAPRSVVLTTERVGLAPPEPP